MGFCSPRGTGSGVGLPPKVLPHGAGAHSRVHLGFCVKGDGHGRPGFRRQRLGGLDLHDPGEGSKESGEWSAPAVRPGKKQGTSARVERLALVIRTGGVSEPLWREACCSRGPRGPSGPPVLEFRCQEADRLRDSVRLTTEEATRGSGCSPGSRSAAALWPHHQLSVSDTVVGGGQGWLGNARNDSPALDDTASGARWPSSSRHHNLGIEF